MSNALQIPAGTEAVLQREFLKAIPPSVRDTDGNWIGVAEDGEVVWQIAEFQTIRELRHFVRTHIAPYIKDGLVTRVNVHGVRGEADGFRKKFTMVVNFTMDWEKVI